jgi:sterol desaturase/sphingolipid hydroxylase (fatty acid hydroxylase superfamily)
VSIGPWSGLSMHPIESFIYLTSIGIHLVIASSPFHLIFHLQFLVFNAVIAHSGFEGIVFKNKKIIDVGRFHHQLHHKFFECNYGNAEMPWDRWFGTFNDGSDGAMKEIRKNRIL